MSSCRYDPSGSPHTDEPKPPPTRGRRSSPTRKATMNFTKGRDRTTAARIYDRLRKRSYRAIGRKVSCEMTPNSRFASDWIRWGYEQHEAYVAGVWAALKAIEQESE